MRFRLTANQNFIEGIEDEDSVQVIRHENPEGAHAPCGIAEVAVIIGVVCNLIDIYLFIESRYRNRNQINNKILLQFENGETKEFNNIQEVQYEISRLQNSPNNE